MRTKKTNIIKKQGTKTLAGILAVGMTLGSPVSALAEDNTPDSTVEQQAETQNVMAKKVDGSDTLVKVSDAVLGMIQRGEIKLASDKFLKDVTTGQKVNPATGERVTEAVKVTKPETPSEPETPTEPSEPETPENPSEPENPETPETPSEPENPETPETPETPSEPENPETPENPGENIETPDSDQNEEPATDETQTETPEVTSNEDLISRQQIVKLPQIIDDFRFWTVARTYAFAKDDLFVREAIPEGIDGTADTSDEALKADKKAAKKEAKKINASYEKAELTKKEAEQTGNREQSQVHVSLNEDVADQSVSEQEQMDAGQTQEQVRYVGKLAKNGLLYILKEENGWLYVESGNVRGFVKASEVYTSDAAQKLLDVYQKEAKKTAAENGVEYNGIEGTVKTAQILIAPQENQAYTYLRATVNQTVADKNYAVVNATKLNVREAKGTESRIVGIMNQGALCYVLADADSDWIYVESGDVRGFVSRQYLDISDEVTAQVTAAGEETYQKAEEVIAPKENQALYYTLTSTKEGTPNGAIRESVIEYASQFIGNPYVWGGTSLTEGADCSGFVQQIYKAYGYDLPRVAADQSQYGMQIPVEDAQPGDLIFYAKAGHVYHVVMYAGDGKTIEAANTKAGIISGTLDTKNAVWATRILDDDMTAAGGNISEVNATQDMYGTYLGNFKITYYCACEKCCNKADGITATGTRVEEGRTIAVDPSVIPYGTKVIIGGHVFTAEDCGGAIKQNHIDIYVNRHEEAQALGVTNAQVYLAK